MGICSLGGQSVRGHTLSVPVLGVSEVPVLWVVQKVITAPFFFLSMSGVSQ